jgi:hypothetical protein
MKKIILVVILLLFAWLALFSPPQTVASTGACQASDSATAKDCFNKVNSGSVDTVEITTQITCSGENACAFSLNNINRPVLIYGTPNTDAGFKVIDDNNYSVLEVNNSSGVTIANLLFDDTSGIRCEFWYGYHNPCFVPPIVFTGGSDNVVDEVTIQNSRYIGLNISKGNNLTIRNSKFINNSWFGVESESATALHIENNLFQDNSSSGIDGYFLGTTDTPSTIRNNILINNHRQAIFAICGPTNLSPCSGGQLVVEALGYSENLIISHNTIKDGSLDANMGGTSGIEINTDWTKNVTIQNNDFHHNTGAGIYYFPSETGNVSTLSVINNMAYDNTVDIYAPGANMSGNCYSAGCNLNAGAILAPSGFISANPNPCTLASLQTTCKSVISWSTSNANNVCILVNSTGPFACSISGTKEAPWISASGDIFVLYANYNTSQSVQQNILSGRLKELSRVTVTGTPIYIPGDLDHNNKVDIFDYNILVDNFGNTTCGNVADIDGNCKVDIFDYNMLVGNFGLSAGEAGKTQ